MAGSRVRGIPVERSDCHSQRLYDTSIDVAPQLGESTLARYGQIDTRPSNQHRSGPVSDRRAFRDRMIKTHCADVVAPAKLQGCLRITTRSILHLQRRSLDRQM